MKKEAREHLSVFGLYARNSIFKVLGILVLMSGVQMAMFANLYFSKLETGNLGFCGHLGYSFVDAIQMSKISQVCMIGFVLLTIVLCMTGTEYSTKTSYTLKRLSVSEKATFVHQMVYNMFAYILFGVMQFVLIFIMADIFVRTAAMDCMNQQTLFLAFYQDYFLHALFPMEDGLLWWRNLCWLIALGMATAEFSYVQRRGSRFNMSLVVLVVMILVFGGNSWGFSAGPIGALGNCIFTSFVALLIVLYVLTYTVFAKEGAYDE